MIMKLSTINIKDVHISLVSIWNKYDKQFVIMMNIFENFYRAENLLYLSKCLHNLILNAIEFLPYKFVIDTDSYFYSF